MRARAATAIAGGVLAVLTLPVSAQAQNATTSVAGGNVIYTGSTGRDGVFLTLNNPPAWIFTLDGNPATAKITAGAGCNDVFADGTRIGCQITGGATIDLNTGDDFFSGGADGHGMTINGGAGNDRIVPSGSAIHTVNGDAGDDRFQLSSAANAGVIDGGAGNDTFEYPLRDDLTGGTGVDIVLVSAPAGTTYSVTLDDRANDGPANAAADNVRADVENVTGGEENDIFVGSAAANAFSSGGGSDSLAGGAGPDALQSGPGDDEIDARDGEADTVDCGLGNDRATVDVVDSVSGCETVTLPDDDRDGVHQPLDCNDQEASIRPGAAEVAGDGIDQDCDGVDTPATTPPPAIATDIDRDGSIAPQDCNDSDAAIHPGATDTPGDGIDQDCNRADAVFPLLKARAGFSWSFIRKRTAITKIALTDLSGGESARLTCTGKGCPFKTKTYANLRKGKRTLAWPLGKKRRLRAGTLIEVRITSPRAIGSSAILATRDGKRDPKIVRACVLPGQSSTSACP